MKLKSVVMFLLLAPAMIFLGQGCDKCTESGTIELSETAQVLSITYVLDSNGTNMLTNGVWNPNNVSLRVAPIAANQPQQARPIQDDLTDGTIDFRYTVDPELANKGSYYQYMLFVTKDTAGTDSFRVNFYPRVDECKEFWSVIEYFRNGQPIGECTDQELCGITVRVQ